MHLFSNLFLECGQLGCDVTPCSEFWLPRLMERTITPPKNTIYLNLSDERCLTFLNLINSEIEAVHQQLACSVTEQKETCFLNTQMHFVNFSLPAVAAWISSVNAIPPPVSRILLLKSLIKTCLLSTCPSDNLNLTYLTLVQSPLAIIWPIPNEPGLDPDESSNLPFISKVFERLMASLV